MKIGVNCLSISPRYAGGVNSFTFGLLDGFARVGALHKFRIFVRSGNRQSFESYSSLPNFRLIEVDDTDWKSLRSIFDRLPWRVQHQVSSRWLNRVFTKRQADLLDREMDIHYVPYCPPRLFPFSSKPMVCSIHDIQHVHHPQFFTQLQLSERAIVFGQCIDRAAAIQASSFYMRDDFTQNMDGLPPSKVAVIPEGVDVGRFATRPRQADVDVREKYGLPKQFLFFPAQLWHHKNHLTVLQALAALRRAGKVLPLVLTGARYEASRKIFGLVEREGLADAVFYLGVVPMDDIVALYQKARLLITASVYESNCIPILEAAAAGTGIVASRIPPNEELAKNLEIKLFEPMDVKGLSDLLVDVWDDDALIRKQIDANRVAINRYDWKNSARQYLELFERVARESGIAIKSC